MRQIDQKIILVTRETRLAGLQKRFSTRSQAKFYVQRSLTSEMVRQAAAAGAQPMSEPLLREAVEREFHEYEEEQQLYDDALVRVRGDVEDLGPKVQIVERGFLPNFVFGPNDIVVTIGQDGLVANVAKYALKLPIVAVNPDPKRIDGVLLPFGVNGAECRAAGSRWGSHNAIGHDGRSDSPGRPADSRVQRSVHRRTIACLGPIPHPVGRQERAAVFQRRDHLHRRGSTGWLSSVFNMSAGLAKLNRGVGSTPVRMKWEDPRLMFVVREPFVSKHSGASIVAGMIEPRHELIIESLMSSGGVIFSDGVEADFLQFNSGVVARVRAAAEHALLVIS